MPALSFVRKTLLVCALALPFASFAEAPESALARCLTEKGATLYVADWCPYCNRLLDDFGPSATQLRITHCFDDRSDAAACEKFNLPGVPIFLMPDPENPKKMVRLVGYASMRSIAEWSGCEDRE